MRVEVEYLEKPVTKEEREVAIIFERGVGAVEKKDPRLLESVFTPDAVISLMTKAGEKLLTRNEFVKKIGEDFMRLGTLSYKEVFIKLKSDCEATVKCVCIVTLRDTMWPNIFRRHFALEKRNSAWYITRLVYID